MAGRFIYENFVDQCAELQKIITNVSIFSNDAENANAPRKTLELLQSDARERFRVLRGLVNELEHVTSAAPSGACGTTFLSSKNKLNALQEAYREAVFNAFRSLESIERDRLLTSVSGKDSGQAEDVLRTQMLGSLKLTNEMEVHARRLADEVARGNANAELVEDSSDQFGTNFRGLKEMGGHIHMADRLGRQLSRRRLADCILFTLVFLFFYLTCAYIIMKRLYFFRLF